MVRLVSFLVLDDFKVAIESLDLRAFCLGQAYWPGKVLGLCDLSLHVVSQSLLSCLLICEVLGATPNANRQRPSDRGKIAFGLLPEFDPLNIDRIVDDIYVLFNLRLPISLTTLILFIVASHVIIAATPVMMISLQT